MTIVSIPFENILSNHAYCLGMHTYIRLNIQRSLIKHQIQNGITCGEGGREIGLGRSSASFDCGDTLYVLSMVGYSFYLLDELVSGKEGRNRYSRRKGEHEQR